MNGTVPTQTPGEVSRGFSITDCGGYWNVKSWESWGGSAHASRVHCPGDCDYCRAYTCEATGRRRGTLFPGIEEWYAKERAYAADRAAVYHKLIEAMR